MKILVFKDGSTREITGEQGKYWLSGEERVRKLSGQIAEVREIEDGKPAGKPKKKSTRKKKESTEVKDDGECGE